MISAAFLVVMCALPLLEELDSKTWKSKQNQDSISFFLQKCSSDDDSMLIDARNRGGLWKVRPEITTIFSVAEIFFKSYTSTSGVVKSIQRK